MERLRYGRGHLVEVQPARGDVDQRAKRCRDPEAGMVLLLRGRNDGAMEDDPFGLGPKTRGHAEVDALGVHVPEPVDGERTLVRDHALAPAPERPPDEVLVRARRPLGESEDAAADAKPVLVDGVVALGRIRVASPEGLAGGEVPCLGACDRYEPPPEIFPSLGCQGALSFTNTIV